MTYILPEHSIMSLGYLQNHCFRDTMMQCGVHNRKAKVNFDHYLHVVSTEQHLH